ncbi:MAG: alpha-xylosidase [Clostridia bacterium]|nr:alpha-xylosidase [Clostridia bacterium]
MLNERLIVETSPKAKKDNMVRWRDYRVTVLSDRLFRLEQSAEGKFRDEATQAVWYRNMPKQEFRLLTSDNHAVIETNACRLILYKTRVQVCVELNGMRRSLDNYGNLLGTCRTLDNCDGNVRFAPWLEGDEPKKVALSQGVCSKTGMAVIDDSDSYTLGKDGQVKCEKAIGTDEYVFAYGDDYRGALEALYMITGRTPLVPRYALGNWWSRYHEYTEAEYLRALNRFEDRNVPFSVATLDMDWHYSRHVDIQASISDSNLNTPKYVGNPEVDLGWTGYTWNKQLFPDPQKFLNHLHKRGMKVALNVHPADGFRYWEDCYAGMAVAMGKNPELGEHVAFDFTYDHFINAYFNLAHTPHEDMGVDFWWIDWQQKPILWHDSRPEWLQQHEPLTQTYDPLWSLNHYHFYDAVSKHNEPMILSRYAGVGSHRYPIGFSGDTEITWKTLAYLPYFTATSSNIGYTWWSHDIGGHQMGEKKNELFLRHVQYGVFSPIMRLHCSDTETMTKEPWAYGNGTNFIAEEFLRFRHKLVPYLYTASYRNCAECTPLIEPLYYEWKQKQAYEYKEEYRFGSQLLVAPVTQKAYPDGYARVKAWLPAGTWTDIFTLDEYEVGEEGKELVLLRDLNSIPVFAKEGGILPLSVDNKNSVNNPEKMEVWVFEGNGYYQLYEDGLAEKKYSVALTDFISQYMEKDGVCMQLLQISMRGDASVVPKKRKMKVCFKNVPQARVRLYVDDVEQDAEVRLSETAEVVFTLIPGKVYRLEAFYWKKTPVEKLIDRAKTILTKIEAGNYAKERAWEAISSAKTVEEYQTAVDNAILETGAKLRLKETM